MIGLFQSFQLTTKYKAILYSQSSKYDYKTLEYNQILSKIELSNS